MAEIITLSSDDEEEEPVPKKRIKLTTISSKGEKIQEESCIVVLDDDEDECKLEKMDYETQSTKIELNGSKSNIDDLTESKEIEEEKKSVEVSKGNSDLENDNSRSELELKSNKNEFLIFLDFCLETLENTKHKSLVESKLPIIKKLYEKIKNLNHDSEELKEMIIKNTEKIKKVPQETVVYFSDVFLWLKSAYKDVSEVRKSSEANEKIIKKLEKALLKIRKKIRALESAEIDFEDEENSSYIQMDRYMSRASQIYNKLCKYRQENPYRGCLLYCRLDFSKSEYSEINQALNKKYKNNKIFPTYYDVDKCIRNCVQEHKIKLSEEALKYEIKHCFEELGKLLQRRRKTDLYNNQRSYIEDTTDPTLDDYKFNQQINANRSEANKQLEQVMEKYTKLQEKGVNPNISSESEDSDIQETGSECEQDENAAENI